jgi:hypothetical protein
LPAEAAQLPWSASNYCDCNRLIWWFACDLNKVGTTPVMATAADQAQHEFWRAPSLAAASTANLERIATCPRCGTEFIVSSLFCHACGAQRPETRADALEIPGLTELLALGERLGLTTPALIAFLFGMFCLVGALSVSVFFSARTVLDWQAIQVWRIEWLLAAVASFVAGCVLKKSS